MDLQKLIEHRDKLIADVTARIESRGADSGAVPRPVELEQAQVQRVEERIESLAMRKEELVKNIDAELEALKNELAARRDRIEAENRAPKASGRKARAPKVKKGPEAAESAATASAPKGRKKPRPSSPRTSRRG